MYLKDIISVVNGTYKQIDVRLIAVKDKSKPEVAFLKIRFSMDEKPHLKDRKFFNSISPKLDFIQKILEIGDGNELVTNMQKGRVKLGGGLYEISAEETNYLREDLNIHSLYSNESLQLYSKPMESSVDNYPALSIRLPFDSTCSGILNSHGIPSIIKGYETSKMIHSFLDADSINISNCRAVLLLPVYCKLKQISSSFELYIHRNLADKLSLRFLNGNPREKALHELLNPSLEDVIRYPIENDLTQDALQISTYCEPLDLELDRKEIPPQLDHKVILPRPVRYDSIEDLQILLKMDENKYLERKPFLSFDPKNGCVNEGKEYDVMRVLDSFLNTDGGLLAIGVNDRGDPIGLDGDYSCLMGDRENFDKFRNHLQKLIRGRYFKNSIVEEHIEIERRIINGKDICLVDIQRS